jgi:phospholipid/cholesterol/gamma-HCH transport system substrate-binding protein
MTTERDAERRLERRVGGFLLLCLAGFAILAALAITGNDALRAKQVYGLQLEHGTGIAPGTPVTLSGIQVGAVTDVGLSDDRKVMLQLAVDARYAAYIYADSVGRATTTLTGKTILIEGGTKASGPMPDKGTLVSGNHFDVMLAIERLDLVHTLQQVQEILTDINTVANQLNLGTGDLPAAIDNLMGLLGDVREGKGSVGKLFSEDNLLVSVQTTLTEVNKMAEAVDKAATSLDKTATNIDDVTGSVVESVDQLVGIGKSFETTSDHLAGTSASIGESMARMNTALDELSKTLKAIQNMPIVKGKVKKLEEEEAAANSSD